MQWLARAAIVGMLLFVGVPHAALAQVDFDYGNDLSLSASPQYPRPGDSVRVTAKSALTDLQASTVVWYTNGKKVSSGPGLTSIDVQAGAPGSALEVTAEAGDSARASITIRPVELDLVWESDSYVPPFFRGRALPSPGSNVRVEAVPRFRRVDKSLVKTSDIIFTWRKNGLVVPAVSGRGRSSALVPAPVLYGADTIAVDARSSDGMFVASASIRVPSVEPMLLMYEESPLFGMKYFHAFEPVDHLTSSEASVRVVPFYLAGDPKDGDLQYQWSINGKPLTVDAARPDAITIGAAGAEGESADINVAVSSRSNMFLNAEGTWNVQFAGGSSSKSPFGTQ